MPYTFKSSTIWSHNLVGKDHDSTEYLDWRKAERAVFPNLKPSTKTISLRLPQSMLAELRQLANQRDVPYQSLIKIYLRERIDEEYHRLQ